jgi:hypothetical protein
MKNGSDWKPLNVGSSIPFNLQLVYGRWSLFSFGLLVCEMKDWCGHEGLSASVYRIHLLVEVQVSPDIPT